MKGKIQQCSLERIAPHSLSEISTYFKDPDEIFSLMKCSKFFFNFFSSLDFQKRFLESCENVDFQIPPNNKKERGRGRGRGGKRNIHQSTGNKFTLQRDGRKLQYAFIKSIIISGNCNWLKNSSLLKHFPFVSSIKLDIRSEIQYSKFFKDLETQKIKKLEIILHEERRKERKPHHFSGKFISVFESLQQLKIRGSYSEYRSEKKMFFLDSKDFTKLKNLKHLELWFYKESGLNYSVAKNLKSLESLKLVECDHFFQGIRKIERKDIVILEKMKLLDLHCSYFNVIGFQMFKNLKIFRFTQSSCDSNKMITDACFRFIPNLEELSLAFTVFKNDGFKYLKNLKILRLKKNYSISKDIFVELLKNCKESIHEIVSDFPYSKDIMKFENLETVFFEEELFEADKKNVMEKLDRFYEFKYRRRSWFGYYKTKFSPQILQFLP